jgi:hypothetical protein
MIGELHVISRGMVQHHIEHNLETELMASVDEVSEIVLAAEFWSNCQMIPYTVQVSLI